MAEPLPITAVNHVGRTSRHVEESRRFYREVLGFREVARPNFNFAGAWLYNYGIMIHIIESKAAPGVEGEIETRGDHLALHTNDLSQAEKLLAEHNIPFRKNTVADTGLQQIFFHDPDGHTIEIGTYPPTPAYL